MELYLYDMSGVANMVWDGRIKVETVYLKYSFILNIQ